MMETHSSIQYLNKLAFLYLVSCESLRSLPHTIRSESLFELRLSGCTSLKRFPKISSWLLKDLDLESCGIEELPSSIECLSNLRSIDLLNCTRLEYIESSIFTLKSLESIRISKCSNLRKFPEIPSCIIDEAGIKRQALSKLELNNCSRLESFPSSLCMFESLASLKITDCPRLDGLPDELGNLKALEELTVEGTAIREVPESLGQLSSLNILVLHNNNFKRIPESIKHISKLEYLNLSYCERLQNLPELPCNLYDLDAHHCASLEALSGFSSISSSSFVDLRNCFKLDPSKLYEIGKDSLQNDHARWMKKRLESHNDECIRRCMYFPGNEIPKWFSYQSMGSSVTLKTPPAGFFSNNKLMGFSFCAVIAFPDDHPNHSSYYSVECEWRVKSEGCYRHFCSWYFGTISYVESDHVLLGYYLFNREDLDKYYDEVNEATLYILGFLGERLECCGVKKCGIHLLYAEDSTELAQEEEEPHPKRLKYSSTRRQRALIG